MKDKSNLARSKDHLACLRFSFLDVMKYFKFFVIRPDFKLVLRSFHKGLHSSSARTMASIPCHGFHSFFKLGIGIWKECYGMPLSQRIGWDRTAPVAKSELSASMRKGLELSGKQMGRK